MVIENVKKPQWTQTFVGCVNGMIAEILDWKCLPMASVDPCNKLASPTDTRQRVKRDVWVRGDSRDVFDNPPDYLNDAALWEEMRKHVEQAGKSMDFIHKLRLLLNKFGIQGLAWNIMNTSQPTRAYVFFAMFVSPDFDWKVQEQDLATWFLRKIDPRIAE